MHCDDLINGPIPCMYDNTALGQSSRIDHFFVTPYVRACTSRVLVIDSGLILATAGLLLHAFSCHRLFSPTGSRAINKPVSLKVLWNKDNLTEYYRLSGEALAALNLGCSRSSCDVNCISHNYFQSINDYYHNIVSALKGTKKLYIPSVPHSALRNF